MPVDPYAVLQALLRAEASRAQRADRRSAEPAEPARPAPVAEPPVPREDPTR
ncbi:hypothetical protein R1T08_35765 [Streptomyces sp. SBC-4]|nr:hypothetical protein [Streptomyces sp. SBC-4]MDV5149352.1 hypothetical protein [Streptomyces sp. SBC-4]